MSRPINGKTVLDSSSSKDPSFEREDRGQTNLTRHLDRRQFVIASLAYIYIYIHIREKFQTRSAREAGYLSVSVVVETLEALGNLILRLIRVDILLPPDNHSNPPIGIEQVIGQDSLIDHR